MIKEAAALERVRFFAFDLALEGKVPAEPGDELHFLSRRLV
jgi:hypothetical protein